MRDSTAPKDIWATLNRRVFKSAKVNKILNHLNFTAEYTYRRGLNLQPCTESTQFDAPQCWASYSNALQLLVTFIKK